MEITKFDYTLDAVQRVQTKHRLLFMKKSNRDIAFELAKQAGLLVRKRSDSNQRIHPEYIEDYTGTIDVGFGNTMYNTTFSKLYVLEEIPEYS